MSSKTLEDISNECNDEQLTGVYKCLKIYYNTLTEHFLVSHKHS